MKIGKLNFGELDDIIKTYNGYQREDVKGKPSVGEDCAIIHCKEDDIVLSTDPITGASENIGKLAVDVNINDIASSGVSPVGILVTILAPPTSDISEIVKVMKDIHEKCMKLKIAILGGHTEVTDAVNRLIVSCTAVGRGDKNKAISTAGARLNDDIIVTKEICLEGSLIALSDHKEKLNGVLTKDEEIRVLSFEEKISVLEEGLTGGELEVNSMHDITEGGLLGALFELSSSTGLGFSIDEALVPINEESLKICKALELDPLRFISSGSMIMIDGDGKRVIDALNKKGIRATIIGKVIEEGFLLKDKNGNLNSVTEPRVDELFKL